MAEVGRFETTTETARDRAIVRVRGYLSGLGGEMLEDEVDRLLHTGKRRIIINFRETDLVNSVGVSILISVIEKVREKGGALYFSELASVNEEIFRLMGLHKHVPFIPGDGEDESGEA